MRALKKSYTFTVFLIEKLCFTKCSLYENWKFPLRTATQKIQGQTLSHGGQFKLILSLDTEP